MQASPIDQGTVLDDQYILQGPVDDQETRLHHATHLATGRPVVVRFWRTDDEVAIQRVLERLDTASRIRHPALSTLEAFGQLPDGMVFLVSEHVQGEALDRWADRAGIPPLPSVIELLQRLCVGLNAAHRNQLAHDALNPRNVLVTVDTHAPLHLGGKLLDLGVPACMRSWPPRLGAAQFMAPEQLIRVLRADEAARGADVAMNVYSCGGLLYYLCTGGAPFLGRNLEELAHAHAAQKLVPPSKINPQIPGSLQAVILRALAFAPEERFANMSELNAALAAVRAGGASGVHEVEVEVERSGSAVGPRVARKRRRAQVFEERPTSEISAPPPARPLPPPPPPARPPVPPSRAEPPALIPISALLVEPAPAQLVVHEAIVVPIDGQHALASYREPLPEKPRRRTRLALASAGALIFAASAASAYVLLQQSPVPELDTPADQPGAGAASVAREMRRIPARPLVATVPVPVPTPAPDPLHAVAPPRAPSELVVRARDSRWRAAPRVPSAEKVDPFAGSDDLALEPASAEASVTAPAAPEPAAARDDQASAGTSAPPARTAAMPEVSPAPSALDRARERAPERAPERARAPAPLAATPEIRELTVRGSLATSEVRRALDRIKPQLAACYASAARAAGRNGYGELRIEVEIDERGRGHAPLAKGSSLPGLERCLERAASKLAARPPDTGTVKATWKVVFEP